MRLTEIMKTEILKAISFRLERLVSEQEAERIRGMSVMAYDVDIQRLRKVREEVLSWQVTNV